MLIGNIFFKAIKINDRKGINSDGVIDIFKWNRSLKGLLAGSPVTQASRLPPTSGVLVV